MHNDLLSLQHTLLQKSHTPRDLLAESAFASYLLAPVAAQRQRFYVIVAPTPEAARRWADQLRFFWRWFVGGQEDILTLPDLDWSPFGEISPERPRIARRLLTLARLQESKTPRVLVLSAESLLRKVIPRNDLRDRSLLLLQEEEIPRDLLVKKLLAAGYHAAPLVEDIGSFHVKGGIVDIFSSAEPYPARLEFYGDFVESIRYFDPKTQRSLEPVSGISIVPVREEHFSPERVTRAKQNIRAIADSINFPSVRARQLIEEIDRAVPFFGSEALAPTYHAPWETIFSYLPEDTHFIIDDPVQVRRALTLAQEREEEAFLEKRSKKDLCLPYEQHFASAQEVLDALSASPLLRMHRLLVQGTESGETVWDEMGLPQAPSTTQETSVDALQGIGTPSDLLVQPPLQTLVGLRQEIAQTQHQKGEEILGPLRKLIQRWTNEGLAVGFVAASTTSAERLAALLRAVGVAAVVMREPPEESKATLGLSCGPLSTLRPERPEVRVLVGELDKGFVLSGVLALVSEEEIFGPRARRRVAAITKQREPFSTQLSDLNVGDLVVHMDHGIGRYQGLFHLTVGGLDGDFILIEYAEKSKLYLPIHRLGKIQRYVGGDLGQLQLDKLGGTAWEKVKKRVSKAVREMAEQLLRIQAQRKLNKARSFPSSDDNLRAFEASFGFPETPDQQGAIDAVIKDLSTPQPMDRLVCGDVGYGKTEVAMRAAFHVAMQGGQVAVLVPTTVLAQQHFVNFRKRMQHWPLRIEVLSRFVSAAEQKKILKDTAEGKVDILIGTHRVLSQDVKFSRLDLIVIDEEHRFGVAHKERLKKLKTEVHVLTLTATPIPRTLHMAMTGLRDLSIIATAPVDRLAVRTFLARTSDDVVRDAVRRELQRGGQVFFVHNRVQSLPQIEEHLRRLVPEARLAVAHGQMAEGELERVIVGFVQGSYDVLLCTAIVESGLDIPRANTILINRADTFGLAQLYQLRGRVGRSSQRAYCHLLIPPETNLNEEAKQRLAVLQRFTELGAGFQIASQDLEIRGAGNMIGEEQSGHIAEVGFELYTELLDEAIASLKGEEHKPQLEPEIQIDVVSRLPETYIEDVQERLRIYRRLNKAEDAAMLEDISQELVDRFGPEPEEVENLMGVMFLQKQLRAMNVVGFDLRGNKLQLNIGEQSRLVPEKILGLLRTKDSPYRLTPDLKLQWTVQLAKGASNAERLATVQTSLAELWTQVGLAS